MNRMVHKDLPRRVLNYRPTPDGHVTSDIPHPCCVPVLLAAREGRDGAGHANHCPVLRYIGFEGPAGPSQADVPDDAP